MESVLPTPSPTVSCMPGQSSLVKENVHGKEECSSRWHSLLCLYVQMCTFSKVLTAHFTQSKCVLLMADFLEMPSFVRQEVVTQEALRCFQKKQLRTSVTVFYLSGETEAFILRVLLSLLCLFLHMGPSDHLPPCFSIVHLSAQRQFKMIDGHCHLCCFLWWD